MQHCLSFSLGECTHIDAADRSVHAALGLRFRGRRAWPQFRSHAPPYLPKHLAQGEAEFLATCLEQVCQLTKETDSGRPLPELHGDDDILVRRRNSQGTWETGVIGPPELPSLATPMDEQRLESVRSACPRTAQEWEMRVLALVPMVGEATRMTLGARSPVCRPPDWLSLRFGRPGAHRHCPRRVSARYGACRGDPESAAAHQRLPARPADFRKRGPPD